MFGPHVDREHSRGPNRPSIVDHIRAARTAAAAVGFDAQVFQIFIAGPRSHAITLQEKEAVELRAFIEAAQEGHRRPTVFAHGTYLDYPWSGPARAAPILEELEICDRAGISGLVVHLGKPKVEEVAALLPLLAAPPRRRACIFLETPHLKPEHSHYETPEKLSALFRAVRAVDPTLSRFGLCVDTAHLWSCGVDLSSYEAADDWIRRLEAVEPPIPANRILLHLNDSLNERGSGRDRHAALLEGQIWGGYRGRPESSGLAAFVAYALRRRIPAVLERKPPEALLGDYALLRRLLPPTSCRSKSGRACPASSRAPPAV
jgi:deoxyribonuclease-4